MELGKSAESRLGIFLALFAIVYGAMGYPHPIFVGGICTVFILFLILQALSEAYSNSVILPTIEIMIVLLAAGWLTWKMSPSRRLVLEPNRARLEIVLPIDAYFECLTQNGWRKLGLGDTAVVEPDIGLCKVTANMEARNYGQATIPAPYFIAVNIFLEDHYLNKADEDKLANLGGGFGKLETENPLSGNTPYAVPFPVYSSGYLRPFLQDWREHSGALLVLVHSRYSDYGGELFTDECFYILPPDFISRQLECRSHNGTYSSPDSNGLP